VNEPNTHRHSEPKENSMNLTTGWHPDPQNPDSERWWDGQRWGEQTRPNAAAAISPADRRYRANLIAALVASAGIIIGSLGPWANFFAFTKNGTEGDGIITLVLGAVATALLFVRFSREGNTKAALRWIAPAMGVICLVMAIYDLFEVSSITGEFFGETVGVQIGWGLWLLLLSSAVLCLTSSSISRRPANL